MSPILSDSNRHVNRSGFTLLEVLIVTVVLALLYSVIAITIKPDEIKSRARDVVRITEINKLYAVVEQYIVDKATPPDVAGITRLSTALVGTGPVSLSNGQGWLGSDTSMYQEKLPIDPLNKNPYFYRYRRVGLKYEIDALLEYYSIEANSDGGNSSSRYERGTDLTIL